MSRFPSIHSGSRLDHPYNSAAQATDDSVGSLAPHLPKGPDWSGTWFNVGIPLDIEFKWMSFAIPSWQLRCNCPTDRSMLIWLNIIWWESLLQGAPSSHSRISSRDLLWWISLMSRLTTEPFKSRLWCHRGLNLVMALWLPLFDLSRVCVA